MRTLPSHTGKTYWAGLGYSNITPFNTPGEYSEDEIAGALSAFEGKNPLYLVRAFSAAHSTLDEFAPRKHAGSPALREWVNTSSPHFSSADTFTKPPACATKSVPPSTSTSASKVTLSIYEVNGVREWGSLFAPSAARVLPL